MAEQVRVGVAGTSWWADMMHLPVLKDTPRCELAAVCGRNRTRAEEMAGKYGIPGIYTDYGEMIDRGDLDALVVAVPEDTHDGITMRAHDAGLHVLCEKPLALTVQQARETYERAEAARVKQWVAV